MWGENSATPSMGMSGVLKASLREEASGPCCRAPAAAAVRLTVRVDAEGMGSCRGSRAACTYAGLRHLAVEFLPARTCWQAHTYACCPPARRQASAAGTHQVPGGGGGGRGHCGCGAIDRGQPVHDCIQLRSGGGLPCPTACRASRAAAAGSPLVALVQHHTSKLCSRSCPGLRPCGYL